jgi:8-oxo-dGTP diphosphatase
MPPFVSASAIVLDDTMVLAVLDPLRGEPVLPGGHLRWREAPEAACVRETQEETGMDVAVSALVGVYSGMERTGEAGIVRVIYLASLRGGTLTSSGEGIATWMATEEFIRRSERDGPILQKGLAVAQCHPVP